MYVTAKKTTTAEEITSGSPPVSPKASVKARRELREAQKQREAEAAAKRLTAANSKLLVAAVPVPPHHVVFGQTTDAAVVTVGLPTHGGLITASAIMPFKHRPSLSKPK